MQSGPGVIQFGPDHTFGSTITRSIIEVLRFR
jgi:hypothetical protein